MTIVKRVGVTELETLPRPANEIYVKFRVYFPRARRRHQINGRVLSQILRLSKHLRKWGPIIACRERARGVVG